MGNVVTVALIFAFRLAEPTDEGDKATRRPFLDSADQGNRNEVHANFNSVAHFLQGQRS